MKKYVLSLNVAQIELVAKALESYSRLGIGQLENVLLDLGFHHYDQFGNNIKHLHTKDIQDAICKIKQCLWHLDALNSSFGIHSTSVSDNFRICWDIRNIIRHLLALEKPIGGVDVALRNVYPASTTSELASIEIIDDEKETDSES
jgi:hypothetical protein